MLPDFVLKNLGQLVKAKDGSLSVSKLATATAHFNCAWLFVYLTLKHGFIWELWSTYIGATIVHHGYDKWLASRGSKTVPPEKTHADVD